MRTPMMMSAMPMTNAGYLALASIQLVKIRETTPTTTNTTRNPDATEVPTTMERRSRTPTVASSVTLR